MQTDVVTGAFGYSGAAIAKAMAAGLATSDAPPAGQASLMDWIADHGDELGRDYANELDRHYR
jgi:hypothetical protein